MIPYDCLGKWLKEHPHASELHRVLRYEREWLVTYCGRRFPSSLATKASGVLCCPTCTELYRQRVAEGLKRLARKYSKSPVTACNGH